MGSLTVKIDKDQASAQKLPETIDIGLNLINVRNGTLVPELVRINKGMLRKMYKNQYFEYCELSKEAVDLLK